MGPFVRDLGDALITSFGGLLLAQNPLNPMTLHCPYYDYSRISPKPYSRRMSGSLAPRTKRPKHPHELSPGQLACPRAMRSFAGWASDPKTRKQWLFDCMA